MNIFKTLGILFKEDIISNMLIGLINESETFRQSFLNNIVGLSNPQAYNIQAFPRIVTSKGVPDIVIKGSSDKDNILIIVENKLKADEGCEQTARYSSEECLRDLCKSSKINLEYETIKTKFIYLTLIPEQIPTGDKFINKTYKDIVEKVNVKIEDFSANVLYENFIAALSEFYSNTEIRKEDKLFDLLCENIEDEKVFIRFNNLMKILEFNNELQVNFVGKGGGFGRENFIGKISNANWIGDRYIEMKDGYYNINGSSYDIHIEFSFDTKNRVINLPLHYETNPHIPKNKLLEHCKEEEYYKYLRRREKFKSIVHEEIRALGNPLIKTSSGSNQIASIKIKLENDIKVENFLETIQYYCHIISTIVNQTLDLLKS